MIITKPQTSETWHGKVKLITPPSRCLLPIYENHVLCLDKANYRVWKGIGGIIQILMTETFMIPRVFCHDPFVESRIKKWIVDN